MRCCVAVADQRLIPARAGNTNSTLRGCSAVTAHPRSRGEHCQLLPFRSLQVGSSPLARGTPDYGVRENPCARLIPARAGNTRFCGRGRVLPPAHPRSRGEHAVRCCVAVADQRLIPARAGNTNSTLRGCSAVTAHPRSRGEHCQLLPFRSLQVGSSPLARGTPDYGVRENPCARLIPARAGNTHGGLVPGEPVSAHPRSRGEHLRTLFRMELFRGSSPLARGTPVRNLAVFIGVRLIPARAGNTRKENTKWVATAAHPRSRGEHPHTVKLTGAITGSSPLARGTLRQMSHHPRTNRLIPARAGNTDFLIIIISPSSAHPRSRGEHCVGMFPALSQSGSSPLARGTPLLILPLF